MAIALPVSARRACQIMHAVYYEPTSVTIAESFSAGGVQASLVDVAAGRLLVIQGTNEPEDWVHFNLNVFPPEVTPGDTLIWHKGFYGYAAIAQAFAKGKGAVGVIGHSLGAAAAQIVGSSLRLPTIALASPRPLFSPRQPDGAAYVLNICRIDDAVCHVPLAFSHVGKVRWLQPEALTPGVEDHRTPRYQLLLDREPDIVAI